LENDSTLIDRGDELIASLDNGPPGPDTIAALKEWSADVRVQLTAIRILRDDLTARITGMAKAIAVAHSSEHRLKEATEMAMELDQLDATGLIATYRKTAARFRDTFRSTYEPYRRKSVGRDQRSVDIGDYK
jgi:hypothetical protein